ncbi:efflux RND transporter periplasmic adaptor subunit [Stenotrophomonas rhizophila]|uniref:efflux RND transporter periplasmic adaptor subunit n=1 Tax=Stenotrophomonas rhizophila TaxID=216778 RepID=UPI0028ACE595|nr:efflux RND transporter periplasmic adaptor subunit [Stenotrophomonas rhizophila]MDY0956271.1 efflux RND transporter periplasmic adaptor subunit [Stenotrophomonas rhizophila]
MKTVEKLALAAVLAIALSACRPQNAAPPPQGPPEVTVQVVESKPVVLTTELPGRTQPYLIAEVRPQVGGILQARLFEEGATVKAGQPLYQIDPAPYRATLARAMASLETAKARSERYERLNESQAISHQDWDDARSEYLQAKATAESARIDLGYTRITAPITGRVGRSSLTQGALLTANQANPLVAVQQLDPIYVDIVQPSTAILRLKEELAAGRLKSAGDGQVVVDLSLENGRAYVHQGRLQFSEVSVDEGTGAVTLRAVFPNPDGLLLPGMFVRASLTEGVREGGILVPQRAVSRDNEGKATALVVGSDNKLVQRSIVVDRALGSDWLVTEGLKPGERLVVDGGQRAKPGDAVNPLPVSAKGASAAKPTAPASPKTEG